MTTTVVVKNPCVDTSYVNIVLPATLADLQYIISSNAKTFAPIATGTDAIFVTTEPIVHTLCGNLKFTVLYKGQTNDQSVLTYDETNLDFTAESSDKTLIDDTETYGIIAEF